MLPTPTPPTLKDRLNATQMSPLGGGTDRQAIEYAMGHLEDFEALNFLKDWLKGKVWPEFKAWANGETD
ncbi:hypothetical protein [Rhizobium sp. CECT 9324]|uniref:hypothetical protein n=1 Tax=Rhizobium sp. CECT 9324 TaxID=2845820 RepID=UPI001E5F05C8|nr:hypothetical protein [Rhizobium sp. CECT 9324]CAH0338382.1 hypothetical protein RHI9324_00003 [Rhizobium sp. CECT 9324]CAH0343744.1 hypothetical protein RHI9324_05481 [Rhizobium sp. CECT 9324]